MAKQCIAIILTLNPDITKVCNNPVFSHGYCLYHQYQRTDARWIDKKKKPSNIPKHIIPKLSAKGKAKTVKIQKIKQNLIDQNGYVCFFTGPCTGRLDAFHIFPRGKFPEYATEEWNIMLSTRGMNRIWDQGTWEEILQMPNIHWLLWFIQTKDNDPNKLHQGSFYYPLMERKNK